jgi:hypothetical protein
MNTRPHGRKHTLALWTTVAIADAALVVSSAGELSILLIALAVAAVAGAVVSLRLLQRHWTRRSTPVTQGHRSWQLARAQTEGHIWHESRA